VPCINASVVPLIATREFANLMWPWHWRLGGTYNLLTHRSRVLRAGNCSANHQSVDRRRCTCRRFQVAKPMIASRRCRCWWVSVPTSCPSRATGPITSTSPAIGFCPVRASGRRPTIWCAFSPRVVRPCVSVSAA
jgi:hypothetical protein